LRPPRAARPRRVGTAGEGVAAAGWVRLPRRDVAAGFGVIRDGMDAPCSGAKCVRM